MRPEENLKTLAANPYTGRGISVGLDETGTRALQVYWITGRSANSRNRIFVADGATLRTAAADPSKVQDPRLIIYNAMRELPKVFIVSNGDQTDTIYDAISSGGSFSKGLESRTYEPDPPSNTARISAISDLRSGRLLAEISVVKKSPYADAAQRQTFQYEALPRGAGFTVTTYAGDGNPLPRFEGEPYLLPLAGPPRRVAETIWNALDAANRVCLVVKTIDIATGRSSMEIVNAYKAVG